jgi:hypothetical protein
VNVLADMTFINILNDTVYIHFAFKKLLMPTIFKKSAYEWLIFVSLNNHKKIMTIIGVSGKCIVGKVGKVDIVEQNVSKTSINYSSIIYKAK